MSSLFTDCDWSESLNLVIGMQHEGKYWWWELFRWHKALPFAFVFLIYVVGVFIGGFQLPIQLHVAGWCPTEWRHYWRRTCVEVCGKVQYKSAAAKLFWRIIVHYRSIYNLSLWEVCVALLRFEGCSYMFFAYWDFSGIFVSVVCDTLLPAVTRMHIAEGHFFCFVWAFF